MEVRAYLRTLARYWFLIVLVAIVSGGTAALLVSVKTPSYSASARVTTRPSTVLSDTRTIVDLLGQMASRSVTGTFAQVFTSSEVKAAARQAANLSADAAGDYPIEANILPDSLVIEVSGSGPDPGMLVNYINATVDATVQRSHDILAAPGGCKGPMVPPGPLQRETTLPDKSAHFPATHA